MSLFGLFGNRPWRRIGGVLAAALVVGALGACSKNDPDAMVRSAKEYAAKGDFNAAAIQLKNALQANPANGDARLMLGEALVEMRDPAGGERELRRALELKVPDERVMPVLARALYEQRSFDVLLRELGARTFTDPSVEARVRTYVGEAYLANGDVARAAQAFGAALRVSPEDTAARLGQARLALVERRPDDAMALADAVLKAKPDSAEALATRAEASLAKDDREGAKRALRQAVAVSPGFLAAHFGLISLALDAGADQEAATQLEAARKVAAGDLRVVYFDAVLAYRKSDLEKARAGVLQILKGVPDHVPTLVLAGAIDLQSGQAASAEDRLRRALNRAPSHTGARRLLVAALLRSGNPARALETLQPLLNESVQASPAVLLLAGETYLANGDLGKASDYFEQASRTDAQSTAARTRLGQIALAQGHAEEGIRELEAAASADTGSNQADIALVLTHVRRKEGAKALAAARALSKKQPNNPVSFQLLGGVQLMQKDTTGARASFEQALAVAPNFLPAALNLANLDLADKKPEAARKRLAALAEKDAKNEQVILSQAELEFRTGAPAKDVVALINKAIVANPQSVTARVALVTHHLRDKDPRAAVSAAQDAVSALPKDARVLEMLSVAQAAAGDQAAALDTLARLSQMQPTMVEPLLRLAGLAARTNNPDRAIEALQRAQKVAPDNHQIDRDLVALYVGQGKADLALKQARDLQARAPKFAGGFVLEGDVLLTQNKFPEAERQFRTALALDPAAGQIAGKVMVALAGAGKTAEADAYARRWLADHPKDTQMRFVLADRAMRKRDFPAAAEHYRAVLALDTGSVVALNNLAWIGGETGDPKALSYAERAAQLAPQNASVLDTLGMLLVKRGETSKGTETLSRAVALAPARLDVRLNYARAQIASGQKDAARKTLREIADAKEDAAEKRAASELLQKL